MKEDEGGCAVHGEKEGSTESRELLRVIFHLWQELTSKEE